MNDEIRIVEAEVKSIREVTKPETGVKYRIVYLLIGDSEKAESFITFLHDEEINEGDIKQFEITTDAKGPKITAISELNEDIKAIVKGNQKEIKTVDNKKAELYIQLNGKTYVTQTGLLNEATKKGLKSIITELIEFKDKEIAVVKSTITMKDNSVFTGYGDATKENTNSMMVKALLRLAETRATNRALRLATNIGVTSIEELEN